MLNIKSFLIEKVGDFLVRDICINVYTGTESGGCSV